MTPKPLANNEYGRIDEDHGLLTIEQIKKVCNSMLNTNVIDKISDIYSYIATK